MEKVEFKIYGVTATEKSSYLSEAASTTRQVVNYNAPASQCTELYMGSNNARRTKCRKSCLHSNVAMTLLVARSLPFSHLLDTEMMIRLFVRSFRFAARYWFQKIMMTILAWCIAKLVFLPVNCSL